jgi:GNAT superfamily N-acetyltransferase
MESALTIREVLKSEYRQLGQLMVEVYSKLEDFPSKDEQPGYYAKLSNIGALNEQRATKVLVAISPAGQLIGGVVYFDDMAMYGSGGTATSEVNCSGIRLLGIDPQFRKAGAGKALTNACIQFAKEAGHSQVILHTTQAMQVAWRMYEKLGFERSSDLDFLQEDLQVYGFRLNLEEQ